METEARLANWNVNSICRVCMQGDKIFVPILFEVLLGNDIITVADIITECTKYPVARNDLLPNQICSNCLEAARIAHQFKRQTEEAYRHFKALYDTTWVPKEEKDSGYGDMAIDFITTEKYTQTDKCSECETCKEKFLVDNQLQQPNDENHENEENECQKSMPKIRLFAKRWSKDMHCEFKCHVCSKDFNSKAHLTRHLMKVHTTSERKTNAQKCKEYRERRKLNKTSKNSLKPRGKTNAQKCKEYRERAKLKGTLKPRADKSTQRCREYRARMKLKKELERNKAFLDEPEIENPVNISTSLNNCKGDGSDFHDDSANGPVSNPFSSNDEDDSNFDNIENVDVKQLVDSISRPEIFIKDEQPTNGSSDEIVNDKRTFNIAIEGEINSKFIIIHPKRKDDCVIASKNHQVDDKINDDSSENHLRRESADKEDNDHNDISEVHSVPIDKSKENDDDKINLDANILKVKKPRGRPSSSKTKENRCKECNRTFTRNSRLLLHMLTHTGERPHECNLCEKKFSRPDYLLKHIQSIHSEKVHKCDQCSNAYGNKESLLRHIGKKHNTDPSISCDMCEKKFTSKIYLDKHKLLHTDNLYACKHCPETFPEKDLLRAHTKENHALPRNFLCNMCGDSFIRSEELKIHIRRHTGEKPYKCGFCGKGFTRSSDLRRHERYHIGHKPDLCTLCGKSFHRPYNLAKHMRTHTGEKPYKCNQCPKAYAQKPDLKAHIRRHTGERFRCDMCNACFLRRTGLNNHLRKVHDVKVTSFTGRLPKIVQPVGDADQVNQQQQQHHEPLSIPPFTESLEASTKLPSTTIQEQS